ncbi:putative sterile alpha motif domain-containing protein [Helianthus annuus]|nr:putative sterile alpha motif domain-containing protein [Helianthus annuus]
MSEQPPPPPADNQPNGGTVGPPPGPPPDTVASKRHRRPSVRLGDIGDQHTYDNNHTNIRRTTKQHQWKFGAKDSKSSKTRPLVNLTGEYQDLGEDNNDENYNVNVNNNNNNNINNSVNSDKKRNDNGGVIGSWKVRDYSKSKRGFSGSKRVRTNWGEKFEDVGVDEFDDDDESLYFEMGNEDYGGGNRGKEARVEFDGPWDNNGLERDGVRVWLNQLGLGRYAPVFEVHEVDDEVLPLLTLEDLKDMGISAVGSRRKMFCSIQKLGKGFS